MLVVILLETQEALCDKEADLAYRVSQLHMRDPHLRTPQEKAALDKKEEKLGDVRR
jgi:hypothetical protein